MAAEFSRLDQGGLYDFDTGSSSTGWFWIMQIDPGLYPDTKSGCNRLRLERTTGGVTALPFVSDTLLMNATPWRTRWLVLLTQGPFPIPAARHIGPLTLHFSARKRAPETDDVIVGANVSDNKPFINSFEPGFTVRAVGEFHDAGRRSSICTRSRFRSSW